MFGELLEQLGTEAQRRGRAKGSLLRGLEGSGFWGSLAGDAEVLRRGRREMQPARSGGGCCHQLSWDWLPRQGNLTAKAFLAPLLHPELPWEANPSPAEGEGGVRAWEANRREDKGNP